MPHLFTFLEKSGLVRLAGPMKFPLLPVLVTQPRGRPALVLLHSCVPCRLCAVGHGPGRGLCAKKATVRAAQCFRHAKNQEEDGRTKATRPK